MYALSLIYFLFSLGRRLWVCAFVCCPFYNLCRLSSAVICFIQFGFQILWLFKEANAFLLSKYSGVITLHLNFVLWQFRITELVVLVSFCKHGQESFNERFEFEV